MRVVLGYAPGLLHRRVLPAIRRQGYEPVLYECAGETDWPRALYEELTSGRDVAVVEQDVEVRWGALKGFEECPEPWCFHAYAFSVPFNETGLGDWFSPLGCTRFRGELAPLLAGLADRPGFFDTWVGRDVIVSGLLADAGYRSHRHPGDVIHHHDYNERPRPHTAAGDRGPLRADAPLRA